MRQSDRSESEGDQGAEVVRDQQGGEIPQIQVCEKELQLSPLHGSRAPTDLRRSPSALPTKRAGLKTILATGEARVLEDCRDAGAKWSNLVSKGKKRA